MGGYRFIYSGHLSIEACCLPSPSAGWTPAEQQRRLFQLAWLTGRVISPLTTAGWAQICRRLSFPSLRDPELEARGDREYKRLDAKVCQEILPPEFPLCHFAKIAELDKRAQTEPRNQKPSLDHQPIKLPDYIRSLRYIPRCIYSHINTSDLLTTMRLLTTLTLSGSALTLASGAAIAKSFTLHAVSLSTQQSTQLAVEETEASVHILRATAAPNATAGTGAAATQFSYAASSRQLRNGEYGLFSDALRANLSVTFGSFAAPADGLLATRQQGSATYFVFGPDEAAGPIDGWSLCSTVNSAFYWSGAQEPMDECEKVALEMQ
ncbi:hypothetical protein F5Y10DRAFT_251786 [Nemania abortiva]|nr:hypothetical protein F5Y10DRAFT_251786 [Nemania abortiva]